MFKVIAPAQRHPTNRATLAEFQHYWGESHGPLFSNTRRLRRYVQHLTLPEAYGFDPAPTFDGCSMFWFDALDAFNLDAETDPSVLALQDEVFRDDRQLFDRIEEWPTHHKQASVTAEEKVIVEGPTTPEMVKAIFIVSKLPGLTLREFLGHWEHHLAPLTSRVPGLRRYVQNHAVGEAYAAGGQTHDGWSELWFDDLESLHRAAASPQWRVAQEDAATLVGQPVGVGVARERVQKDFDWTYRDWGVRGLDEDAVRQRLKEQGFDELAADPEAPRRIKTAAERELLAVWTDEHLVTIDDSRIDARPNR